MDKEITAAAERDPKGRWKPGASAYPAGRWRKGQCGNPGGGWKKGQSGNPTGKAHKKQMKFTRDFLNALIAFWKEHGTDTIAAFAQERPADFVKLLAVLFPRELAVDDSIPPVLKIVREMIDPTKEGFHAADPEARERELPEVTETIEIVDLRKWGAE